ncbi:MAG: PHP domain-containing protein [Candidatus Omnitrophota bacterium]
MRFADLHVHTCFSDGTFSPQRIVEEALTAGLSCISITDHDNISGIAPAMLAAGERLEIVSGIELTAELTGSEIHILGYLIDFTDEAFLGMLKEMQEVRIRRIHSICQKLTRLKMPVEPEEIFRLAGEGSVGRLHVARVLVHKGYVANTGEAFSRFIGDKGPAYVAKFKMPPKEAIAWIRRVGGIPVLAHPYLLPQKFLIEDFVKAGIMGIEALYTEHSDFQQSEYVKLAEKFGLLVTGGSDCHGEAKQEAKIGRVRLPYEYVERLKEAKCRLGS